MGFREDEARGGGQEKMGWDDEEEEDADSWSSARSEATAVERTDFSVRIVTHRIIMLL